MKICCRSRRRWLKRVSPYTGYTDPKTTVVKFRKGLDPQIQNTIATMAYGCPSNTSPEDWYKVAKNVDQNHTANEAFKLAYRAPRPASVRPTANPVRVTAPGILHPLSVAHSHPTLDNPVPMDIDGGQRKNQTSLTCYQCHQPGHKALDCPLNFNIRSMTIEEVKMELAVKRDMARVTEPPPALEEVPEPEEDFVQDNE